MAGVVAHTAGLFDELSDAREGPQIGRVPMGFGALEQPALDFPDLFLREAGLSASPSRSLESPTAMRFPVGMPPAGALAAYMKHTNDIGLGLPLPKQGGRLHAASFECCKISSGTGCGSHVPIIPQDFDFVTVLCEIQ
jgi:hypothetical protein